ncbi:cupin domain-containing protein [Siminovitchia sp. 179-K 8D1 HS]|uniref:cupin domain-containing protein n=1 Tax=Siminovitchia sp. 179-K 8D1 HS TaxID=3142385 RepID=UPI0039A3830A
MEIVDRKLDNHLKGTILETFFHRKESHAEIQFGFVTIPPGERVPLEGMSLHLEDEYSFIIKGAIEGQSGGKPFQVKAGQATLIPANEAHWALNNSDEPCEIVWCLIKE